MSDDDTTTTEAPTRRDTIKYGGAVVGGGLLAGCADQSNPDTETGNSNDSGNESTATGSSESWTVEIEPAGSRTFTTTPDTYTVYQGAWADIMAALGQFERLVGLSAPDRFPTDYYNRLPGVSIDTSELTALFPEGADSADKEIFYELDPDINMIDPHNAMERLGFSQADLDEIEANLAPFFGSFIREPDLTNNHPYYTLYEAIHKAAQVFREQERYQALSELHDGFLNDIETRLSASDAQRTFAVINHNWWDDGSEIYAWKSHIPGSTRKPIRDLGLKKEHNAFEGQFNGNVNVQVDAEGLLEADPDSIIYMDGIRMVQGFESGADRITFQDTVVQQFKNDPVLSEVTAVESDRIAPGPVWEIGPVVNFFNTEILAKALYPDQFGEYVGFEEPPDDEKLFDRQRLADIIRGNI